MTVDQYYQKMLDLYIKTCMRQAYTDEQAQKLLINKDAFTEWHILALRAEADFMSRGGHVPPDHLTWSRYAISVLIQPRSNMTVCNENCNPGRPISMEN